MKLAPSSGCAYGARAADGNATLHIASMVGNRSTQFTISVARLHGVATAGPRTIIGTRDPPSYNDPLEWFGESGGNTTELSVPLSATNTTFVLASTVGPIVASRRPISVSIDCTIASKNGRGVVAGFSPARFFVWRLAGGV